MAAPLTSPFTDTIPGSIRTELRRVPTTKSRWASLSKEIIFEANQSAQEMSHTRGVVNWVEQELLTGKPRLQPVGLKLEEIKVTVKFHHSIRPFWKIRALLATAAAKGTVLQWIWGTGEAVGDFVIISFLEKPKKTDQEGTIFVTEVELSLKEYAGPGVAEQTGIDARKAAFANKNPSSVPTVPTMTVSSIQSLSENAQIVKVESAKLQDTMTKWQKAKVGISKAKRDLQKAADKITKAVNNINTAVQIGRNIKNSTSISAAAGNVATAVGALSSAVGGVSTFNQIQSAVTGVSNASGSLEQTVQSSNVVKSWFPTLGF